MAVIDVSFRATWITRVDTGESIQLWKTDRPETTTHDVRVVDYAGRLRIVTTPKRERSTPLTFRGVDEADMVTLRDSWPGQMLLLRDAQGWCRFGTYAGAASTCVMFAPEEPVYEVAITWMDADYDEAVT